MAAKGTSMPANPGSQTIKQPKPADRMLLEMGGIASMEETNGSRPSADSINPILESGTIEEMWDSDEQPTFNAKMLSGCHLLIFGFEVKYGAVSEGDDEINTMFIDPRNNRQMYLLVHASRINRSGEKKEIRLPEPGEEFAWNTSARFIVAKLWWLRKHGYLDETSPPLRVQIVGTKLSGKRTVEKLKPITSETVVINQADDNETQREAPF